jgi:hypothetical protein
MMTLKRLSFEALPDTLKVQQDIIDVRYSLALEAIREAIEFMKERQTFTGRQKIYYRMVKPH